MKTPILDSRRAVMIAVANGYQGGRECAAARLGIPLKRLENQIYGTAGVRPLDDTEISVLEQEEGTTHLPDFICALYGGVFVPLPDREASHADLYDLSFATSTARGTVDLLIRKALADGEIDANEAAEIRAVHAKHLAARHAEVDAVIVAHQRQA